MNILHSDLLVYLKNENSLSKLQQCYCIFRLSARAQKKKATSWFVWIAISCTTWGHTRPHEAAMRRTRWTTVTSVSTVFTTCHKTAGRVLVFIWDLLHLAFLPHVERLPLWGPGGLVSAPPSSRSVLKVTSPTWVAKTDGKQEKQPRKAFRNSNERGSKNKSIDRHTKWSMNINEHQWIQGRALWCWACKLG